VINAASLIPDALGIRNLPVNIDTLASGDLVFICPESEIWRRVVWFGCVLFFLDVYGDRP